MFGKGDRKAENPSILTVMGSLHLPYQTTGRDIVESKKSAQKTSERGGDRDLVCDDSFPGGYVTVAAWV